jgi:hypothetical protein
MQRDRVGDITEGRWSNPFARRALEQARAVNPSYAAMIEPMGWADYDPDATSMRDIGTYLQDLPWQVMSFLPGGETVGLAVRRNLGIREPYPISVSVGGEAFPIMEPPPSYAHALARDAVNIATLPLGFLKAIGLGIPLDMVSDLLATSATGIDYPEEMPQRPRALLNAPSPRARHSMEGWEQYQPPEPPLPESRPQYRVYGLR